MDGPREKLLEKGSDVLSNTELLALMLNTGSKGSSVLLLAYKILKHFGSLDKLFQASLAELMQFQGIGSAKASQLKAAFTLADRKGSPFAKKVKLHTPCEIFDYVLPILIRYPQEVLLVLSKDVKGGLIAHDLVSMGTISELIAHPREIFYPAIRNKAYSIAIAHNHPSGDPTPSAQDIALTKALIMAGKLLGIPLDTHVIVGKTGFNVVE